MHQKVWGQPQTLQEAADCLEKLSALINFAQDLASQEGAPPIQYTISQNGWFGMYLFHMFIQEKMDECGEAVRKIYGKEVNSHGKQ